MEINGIFLFIPWNLTMLKPIFVAVVALFIQQQVTAATIHGNPVDYKVFQSPRDPSYGVRFVEPVLCDPNVVQV